jgi:hypothetical protein
MKRLSLKTGIKQLLMAAIGLTAAHVALGADSLSLPAGMNWTKVADNLIQNGRPTSIWYARYPAKTSASLDVIRKGWESEGKTVMQSESPDWLVISTLTDEGLVTAQSRNLGSQESEVILAHSALDDTLAPLRLTTGFPKLPGSAVMSVTASEELDGRESEVIVMANSGSLQSNRAFYDEHLPQNGWTIQPQGSNDEWQADSTLVYRISRANRTGQLVLRRGTLDATDIVVTLMEDYAP